MDQLSQMKINRLLEMLEEQRLNLKRMVLIVDQMERDLKIRISTEMKIIEP